MSTEQAKCSACSGSGYDDFMHGTCQHCNGYGIEDVELMHRSQKHKLEDEKKELKEQRGELLKIIQTMPQMSDHPNAWSEWWTKRDELVMSITGKQD